MSSTLAVLSAAEARRSVTAMMNLVRKQNGLISSYWGEDGPGARRRYYAITDEGRRRWEENCRDWQTTRALLDALISFWLTVSRTMLSTPWKSSSVKPLGALSWRGREPSGPRLSR